MTARSVGTFERTLARLRHRALGVRLARESMRAFFWLAFAGAVVVLLAPEIGILAVLAGVLGLAFTAALVRVLAAPPSNLGLAKSADDQAGLVDRISSAVELSGAEEPMARALFDDAAQAAAKVEPARVFPWRTPREGWLLPIPLALGALAAFVPGWLSAAPESNPAVEEVLAERTRELSDFVARERGKTISPRREKILKELEELKQTLARKDVDKKDALADLAKMMDELEKERREGEQEKLEIEKLLKEIPAGDKTQAIAQEVEQGDFQQALNKLDELIEELQKKLDEMKKNGADPEELKKLAEELAKLQELKARLLQLKNLRLDLGMLGEALDFLGDFEGELADISELLKGLKFVKLDCKCEKPGL